MFPLNQPLYRFFRLLIGSIYKRQVNIEVLGADHIPNKGAILVCNHRSDVDATLISAAVPQYIAWVYADYMQKVWPTNWLLQLTGMVPINVTGRVSLASMKQALQVLKRGELLGIFPEGESYIFANDFGAPLADFYPGFALIAVKAQVPIIPMVICPIAETLEPITIPPVIRDDLSAQHDLSQIKQIARYQAIKLVIGKPIAVQDLPQSLSRREKIQRLQAQVREKMVEMLTVEGNPSRQV